MKTTLLITLICFTTLLAGCNQGATSGTSSPAAEIEGSYYNPDNPAISLVIKNGQYKQGADDLHAAGTFTARQTDSNKWELEIVHTGRLAGEKSTMLARKEGAVLVVAYVDMDGETRFKRK